MTACGTDTKNNADTIQPGGAADLNNASIADSTNEATGAAAINIEQAASSNTPDNNTADITSDTDNSAEMPDPETRDNPQTTDVAVEPAIGAARGLCQAAPALAPVAESDPGKTVITINPGDDLSAAAYEAPPNTVILIEPGDYLLENVVAVTSDHVTIRGNSNNCNDVRLIGKGMENAAGADAVPHGIYTEASFLKIQNLTIEHVYYHAIAIQSGAESPQIYNVAMLDTGQQFVKVSAVQGKGANNGRLEYSVMKYTNGSPVTDHGPGIGYTQGISLHGGSNWQIRNNRFENINTEDSAEYLWNPAVLAWDLSSNTIVENNLFINVDRAVAFGLWERTDGQHDHSGGIIRNNMVMMRAGMYSQKRKDEADAPIIVWDSPGTQVLHNTILSNGNTPMAIELRFDSNGAIIANNLSDAPIRDRSNNKYTDVGNVQFSDSSIFVNPTSGDLHLVSEVEGITNAVITTDSAPHDINGKPRRVITTDAGADEL